MVHKESIGRVVGYDGKTYAPTVVQSGDKVRFEFSKIINENAEETISSQDIILPYFYPTQTDTGIKFVLKTEETTVPEEIPWSKIKGERGPSGKLNVQIINDVSEIDLDAEGADDTIYIDISSQENEAIKDRVDAWVVYIDDNDNRSLKKINSVIDLTDYYTISQVNTKVSADISNAISGTLAQQQAIYNTLTNGIEINTTEYTSNANVINIISDVTVDGLREEILEMLKKYIKTDALNFDYDDGTLYVSEDD